MRILFITSTRVGDAILSTGLLNKLITDNPDARVTVACGSAAASLFEAVPNLERIIALDKMVLSLHWLGMWQQTVGRWWDVVVDLRNTPMSALLAASRRYRLRRARSPGHRIEQLAAVLGINGEPPAPRVWISDAARAAAASLIPDGPPVLAIGPTANWAAKMWRPECFVELTRRLTGAGGIMPGGRVAVFGRDDERPKALPVIEASPVERCIDLVGRVDLPTAAACLKRSRFYVGNDSGLMHLAAAAGVPTLGLFGPSHEEHYAPWGPLGAVVRAEKSFDEIFPPNFDHRRTGTLMDSLSVDAVEQAARELWRRVAEAAA